MKTLRFTLLAAALVASSFPALGADNGPSAWRDSIVRFDVTRNDHNFRVPWDKRAQTVSKLGAVIDGNEVLTTAQGLANRAMIDEINGRRIESLEDVIAAFKDSTKDQHIIKFASGTVECLDKAGADSANAEILSTYGIPADRRL